MDKKDIITFRSGQSYYNQSCEDTADKQEMPERIWVNNHGVYWNDRVSPRKKTLCTQYIRADIADKLCAALQTIDDIPNPPSPDDPEFNEAPEIARAAIKAYRGET